MHLLVLNCGSATVKFKLYAETADGPAEVDAGNADVDGDYGSAIRAILRRLPHPPDAVAHRVVHGGDFRTPATIDSDVLARIERFTALAPLHNTPALAGIRAAESLGVPQVAVFDTAFHQTIPALAHTYALPKAIRDAHRIRRYGFHGQSHKYVTRRFAKIAGSARPTIVVLHLGSGASATAIREGECVDTTMGLTPLPGLLMSTREGDLDPGIVTHLLRAGMSLDEVERVIWHESGLTGLAGTRDMRELTRREDDDARLAVEIFCYRARKTIGAYLAALGGAEAVVFTGGIGENAPEIRSRIVRPLGFLGIELDETANRENRERITTDAARLHVYVIPTNEELMIAADALEFLARKASG